MAKDGIKVFDPYTNTMIEPDDANPAHRIAVAAQEAAMANEKVTSLDNPDPGTAAGPVLTSGTEIAPPSLGQTEGVVNADEKQALGVETKVDKKDK